MQFHHLFWLGDLNYRIDLSNHDGIKRTDHKVGSQAVLLLEF